MADYKNLSCIDLEFFAIYPPKHSVSKQDEGGKNEKKKHTQLTRQCFVPFHITTTTTTTTPTTNNNNNNNKSYEKNNKGANRTLLNNHRNKGREYTDVASVSTILY